MKILTFSTLFPNTVRSGHGVFVETRLRHLVASGEVSAQVLAPVPWFPSTHPRFGEYAKFAAVPRAEVRFGLPVLHPRYFLPPKIGMTLSPWLLALSGKRAIQKMLATGQNFDLIDAHYFYPDGVAAVLLGRWFNKPVVITARGSDLNFIPNYWTARKWIQWASRHAAGLITVSAALKNVLVRLGANPNKISVLRNGVDLVQFQPTDREQARNNFGLEGFVLLSVGNLIPLKGHDLAIRSLTKVPDAILLVAGAGPENQSLQNLAHTLGVSERVRFLGTLPQDELRAYYGVADALVLASSREGWANVLLESMACGTPVIATAVGGSAEVVVAPEAGLLLATRSAEALVQAIAQLRNAYPDRAATRRYAERFGWDETTAGQIKLFRDILTRHP
jgi:teichuronic acid biosynthesis glycosyltransferase TuaC